MSVATDEPKPKRTYRTKQPPLCPVHGVLMTCRSTTPDMRYFYCPLETCGKSAKQTREDKAI